MPPTQIKFFYGPASAAGGELMGECLQRLTGPQQSFIYVVPTARRARCLEKQLLHARPQGFFRPHLLTFHSLMELLHRRMGGAGVPISASVKAMLLEEIVSNEELGLTYFRRREGRPFPGLVTKLGGFISDLKQNLINPDTLAKRTADIEDPPGPKSRELVRIYREYQKMLALHELIDTDGMFWLVLEEMKEPANLKAALAGIDLLIFDGFFDVTKAEGEVLKGLLESVEQVWLRLDQMPGAKGFGAAERFVKEYCAGAEQIEVAPAPGSPAESICPRLFDPEREAGPAAEADVTILECRDRLAEVEAIAAEIKRIVVEDNVLAERIAVAFKNIHTYAPIVREVFASCGSPYNCAVGRPLSESPVAATLMSILEIVREDYGREPVMKLLRSPYVRFSFEYEGEDAALDGDFLDTEARVARIFRNKDTWGAKLRDSADRLANEMERTEEEGGRTARRVARLIEQSRGIELALAEIAKLSRPMAPKRFGEVLTAIIRRFGIARGIFFERRSEVDEEILERDYGALDKFQKLLKDVIFAASFAEREKFDFEQYAEMIEAGLSGETFDVKRDVDHGVQVLPVGEVRGGDYDVVFLGGLVDGEFPLPEAPRIFYSEKRRAKLGFKTTPSNLEIERYLFAGAAGAARRKLFVSCPRSDGGKMLLKSLFLREIERCLPHVEAKRYPMPGAVFSAKSLQCCLGDALAGRDEEAAERAIQECGSAPGGDALKAMVRCLAAEEMRRGGDSWSRFEGMVTDPEAKALVAEKYSGRALSASTLEKYARCPFRFFAEKLARLVELEEPQEEMDALEKGSIIHRTLSRFYIERRAQGKMQLNEEDDRGAALAHIRRIAEDEFQRMPYEGLFWDIERERIIGGPHLGWRGVLEMFIDTEMNDRSAGRPRFFEVTFGRPHAGEITDGALALPEVVLGEGPSEVRLVGRIDRIEVADVDGEKLALAVDYKTGSAPHYSEILNHLSLQIPIYVMALEESGFRPAGGAHYCLKEDPEKFGKLGTGGSFFGSAPDLKAHFDVPMRNRAGMFEIPELTEILDGIKNKIIEYAAGIRGGVFHPSVLEPRLAGCGYCAFNGVCRRNDAKSMRMAAQACGVGGANDG